MKSIINIFKNDLIKIAKELNLNIDPVVEINKTNFRGDFSTTIALMGAKQLRQKPTELADFIAKELLKNPNYIDAQVAGPGFINVSIDPKLLTSVISKINNEKEKYGDNKFKNSIINLEEVSANPTGWLHVGHARNAVVGDSLTRIFKKDGYTVQTEYYINDAGNQINVLAVTVFVHYLKALGINAQLPENSYSGEAYDDVAQMMIEEFGDRFKDVKYGDNLISDLNVHQIFRDKATEHFLAIIKQQLIDLGLEIEHYSSEQAMYDEHKIEELLDEYAKLGATYQKDGATWLSTTKFGDDKDRVLVKSDGTYTYLVPDLATHNIRLKRTKANKLFNIWGGDHHGYIARLRAGLSLLGNDPEMVEIQMVQMVRLIKDGKEYKMSKRKGTAVWLIDLLDMVGKDSLRYMLASKASSSHMDLDLDLIQQKNASNPVYYAQYATARSNSILRQSLERGIEPDFSTTELLSNSKEIELLVTLDSFSEIIRTASRNRAQQLVTDYIQSIAKQFHSYYSDVKIMDDDNLPLTRHRLALVTVVLQVLKNSFDLIGVSALEKM